MKKMVTVGLMLLVSTLSFAQHPGLESRNFKVSSFSGLEISGIFDVTLVQSSNFSVKVETHPELFEYLEVYVKGDVLHLGYKNGGIPKHIQRKYNNMEIQAKVSMPVIRNLEMSGVTKLTTNDSFRTTDMSIELSGVTKVNFGYLECLNLNAELSGVSKIDMKVKAEELNLEASGASKAFLTFEEKIITFADIEVSGTSHATLTGRAIRSAVDVSGAASFNGLDFQVESMKAVVSGAAKAEVKVIGTLEPEVSGASKLRYNKNASLQNVRTSGASHMTSY